MERRNEEKRNIEQERRINELDALRFQGEHLKRFLESLGTDTDALLATMNKPANPV